jgi:predicted outer membrane protein
MRRHFTTALALIAPVALWAGVAAAQDTTQNKTNQNQSQYQYQTQSRNADTGQMGQQSDEAVLMKLHRTNQMEIRAGHMAQTNGSSKAVKSFGSKLVRDHTASDKKVVALAQTLGITLGRDGMDSMENGYQGRRGRHYGQRGDSTRMGGDTTQRNDSTYSSYPRSYNQNDSTQQRDTTRGQYGQGQYQNQSQNQYGQDSTRENMREEFRRLATLKGAAFDTAFATAMVNGHNRAIEMLERVQGQVQHEQLRSLIASTLPTLRQHLQTAQALTGNATTTSSR